MIKKITIIFIFLFLTSGCGFEPLYSSKNNNNFSIEKISFVGDGDRTLNNYLKRNLNNYRKPELSNKIFLDVETIYTKNALSKNTTATVNEYELIAKVIFKIKPNNKKFIFTQKKIMKNIDNNSDERDSELAIKQTFANIITNELIQSLIASF